MKSGLPVAAESEFSTYGHLVDCYLEIVADRELLGAERTDAIIRAKPWSTWIYKTVLADEKLIAGIVDRHQLRVPTRSRRRRSAIAAAPSSRDADAHRPGATELARWRRQGSND